MESESIISFNGIETDEDCLKMFKGLDPSKYSQYYYSFQYPILCYAVNRKWYKSIRYLISRGYPVSIKDKSGQTALFRAVLGKDSEIANLLLDLGANDEGLTNSGDSAAGRATDLDDNTLWRVIKISTWLMNDPEVQKYFIRCVFIDGERWKTDLYNYEPKRQAQGK